VRESAAGGFKPVTDAIKAMEFVDDRRSPCASKFIAIKVFSIPCERAFVWAASEKEESDNENHPHKYRPIA
jgi:hypothetical protein